MDKKLSEEEYTEIAAKLGMNFQMIDDRAHFTYDCSGEYFPDIRGDLKQMHEEYIAEIEAKTECQRNGLKRYVGSRALPCTVGCYDKFLYLDDDDFKAIAKDMNLQVDIRMTGDAYYYATFR